MRIRYSLRATVLAILILCVVFAWIGYQRVQVVQPLLERNRVREAYVLRGVRFSNTWDDLDGNGNGAVYTAVDNETTQRRMIRRLFGVSPSPPTSVVSFADFRTEVTDDDILQFRAYPEIEYFQFTRWELRPARRTNASIPPGTLVFGEVKSPKVTDRSLEVLDSLPRVRHLIADGCAITDAGCVILARQPSLEFLALDDTRITNEGLLRLVSCKSLRQVNLRRTNVTRKGVNQFERIRPDVQIRD